MPRTPEQLEHAIANKIAQAIQTSPEDALLGFLDVDESTQQEILHFLKTRPSFVTINQYLRRYPALTSYALAVAAPIGLQDVEVGNGAVYGAWNASFGFFPSAAEREPLAVDFQLCLERLGLQAGTISPDHDFHWMGGCYLFHGAILPHYVEPLRSALNSVQKVRPLPDPDDAERATYFASHLAEKVHPTQTRLRKTLQSQVGSLLVRRLVRWHLTGDDSLFPAHIQPLLQEQRGRGVFLRSPFIQFDALEGQLQLVLPPQTPKVADANSRWVVAGQQFRATTERPPIPLDDLGIEASEFDVTLSRLKDDQEDLTHHLEAGISPNPGFRLFDASTGRERKIIPTGNCMVELNPEQTFFILPGSETEILSEHKEEQAGNWRFVQLKPAPGAPPLLLKSSGLLWSLKARVRPGLYFYRDEARMFRVSRQVDRADLDVCFGSTYGLTCAVPADAGESAKIHFSSRLSRAHDRVAALPNGHAQDGLVLSDASSLLNDWVQSLPAAVHAVALTLECDGIRISKDWFFWKGLNHISLYGDFHCDSLPANLTAHSGFQRTGQALVRPQKHGAKSMLTFASLGRLEAEKWDLPANRVGMTLISADGPRTELDPRDAVDVLINDPRTVQFHFGGLLPISLTCGAAILGDLSPGRPVISRFLASIMAEHGRVGMIKAQALVELPNNEPWTVLRWRTPLTATDCRQELGAENKVVWMVRKLSALEAHALRLNLWDIKAKIDGKDFECSLELPIPREENDTAEMELKPGFQCSLKRIQNHLIQVRLEFDRAELPGVAWAAQLECQLHEDAEWQPVMSREAFGRLAVVRMIFLGGAPAAEEAASAFTDLFWGKPLAPLPQNSPAWQLQGDSLDRWLQVTRWLTGCKYPTAVWKQNGYRLKSLCTRISAICFQQEGAAHPLWWSHAVEELQRHANDAQPVVMPCLLLANAIKMASTSFRRDDVPPPPESGLVSRAFYEAMVYQSRPETHALGYIRDACSSGRLDLDFLIHCSNFNQLTAGKQVELGKFNYRDWSNKLAEKINSQALTGDIADAPLLSPDHLVACLRKAKQRADVLLSITEQDYGHWLSSSIASLWSCSDRVMASIGGVLGHRLSGTPPEVLLRPLTQSELFLQDPKRKEFLAHLMASSCLLALLLRAKSAGLVSTTTMDGHLNGLLGQTAAQADSEEKLASQIALVAGTAPELLSFYLLCFTLALQPNS